MKYTFITFILLIFSTQLVSGQNLKRANHLFEKKAYLEAAALYQNEEDKTQEVLQNLGDCYYFNSNMNEAEKWYKTLFIQYENKVESNYLFKYAQVLKGVEKYEEADKWFQKYLQKEGIDGDKKIETLVFFEKLNSEIERPYIAKISDINTEYSDFGPAYVGNKIVFASSRNNKGNYTWNNQPYLDLFVADVNEDGVLTNTVPFSKNINTKMHESNAAFTKDGKTMYFTRNNFKDGKKVTDENKVTQLKIYKAQFINSEWTNITDLPFNSDKYSTEHPALSPDEKQLYFSSDMPGSLGSFDIFVVDINSDGTFGAPKNLGDIINTKQREQFPFISENNTLYFASNGHFGMGGLDIFKSQISKETYAKPINLSNIINSNLDDFGFIINEEKETGYFSSNRKGGLGDDDIYQFTRKKLFYVTGLVKDKDNLLPLLGSKVSLLDDKNNLIEEMKVQEDGIYSFKIAHQKNYMLKASQKAYIPATVDFSTNEDGNINKKIDLFLEEYAKVEKDIVSESGKTQIKINPIYFDFDKWDILPKAALELNRIVEVMKKYPDMIIEVGAHTDFRGDDNYNIILSEKRATSVRNYLVNQGIPDNHIKSVGYGETHPINECIKEGICTSEGYGLNRRCEFVILN